MNVETRDLPAFLIVGSLQIAERRVFASIFLPIRFLDFNNNWNIKYCISYKLEACLIHAVLLFFLKISTFFAKEATRARKAEKYN